MQATEFKDVFLSAAQTLITVGEAEIPASAGLEDQAAGAAAHEAAEKASEAVLLIGQLSDEALPSFFSTVVKKFVKGKITFHTSNRPYRCWLTRCIAEKAGKSSKGKTGSKATGGGEDDAALKLLTGPEYFGLFKDHLASFINDGKVTTDVISTHRTAKATKAQSNSFKEYVVTALGGEADDDEHPAIAIMSQLSDKDSLELWIATVKATGRVPDKGKLEFRSSVSPCPFRSPSATLSSLPYRAHAATEQTRLPRPTLSTPGDCAIRNLERSDLLAAVSCTRRDGADALVVDACQSLETRPADLR